jgi:hypothetical protein
MTDDEIYEMAASVDYSDAQRYVLSRGWVKHPSSPRDGGYFHYKKHDAQLPMSREYLDYDSAMVRFATLVAKAEGRKFEHVLLDLAAKDVDRHRTARVGAKDASLDATMGLLEGMQRGLAAAAASVLQPRPVHPLQNAAEVQRFVNATRFTNTEAGSFVVVIDTPLEVQDAAESFGRLASVSFMRSLAHIARSLKRRAPERIVHPSPAAPVVSANLCEALLRMAPKSESSDLRFAVSWSPSRDNPIGVAKEVILARSMYEPLEKVAAQLRRKRTNVGARRVSRRSSRADIEESNEPTAGAQRW